MRFLVLLSCLGTQVYGWNLNILAPADSKKFAKGTKTEAGMHFFRGFCVCLALFRRGEGWIAGGLDCWIT